MPLLEEMSAGLMLPRPLISGVVRKASYAYKSYYIPKRSGGQRTIHHPSKELKALQRWLLHNVIAKWPVHDAAYAYREGVSIRDHAEQHVRNSFVLRMDLKNFFPSLDAEDIQAWLGDEESIPGQDWSPDDIFYFTEIVCRFGRLTIGAPTSPALSNSMCFDLDARLSLLAAETGTRYTRYADDLFFSTSERDILGGVPNAVKEVLTASTYPKGLAVRDDKTRHASKKGRRQVTGLVLGSDGKVHAGRARKRFVRRQMFRFAELADDEREQLAGHIAFIMSIDADFLNALVLKYGKEAVEDARSGGAG